MDEFLQPVKVDDETADWVYTCPLTDGHGRPGPYSWPWVAPPSSSAGDPLGLGLDVELPAAVGRALDDTGAAWVEYGLVERSYALANPQDWATLLARYDHTHYHPDGATKQALPYTASKYLARALGALRTRGVLGWRQGKGTGRWKYNASISVYGRPDTALDLPVLSWEASGLRMRDYMPEQRPVS